MMDELFWENVSFMQSRFIVDQQEPKLDFLNNSIKIIQQFQEWNMQTDRWS
jgi:hypothetical protein